MNFVATVAERTREEINNNHSMGNTMKKKSKKFIRKLALAKNTVRRLRNDSLEQVAGGPGRPTFNEECITLAPQC